MVRFGPLIYWREKLKAGFAMGEEDKNLLEVLHKRIDQHLTYYDILEGIRWKFTAAFGTGAGAAIAFAVSKMTANAAAPDAGMVKVAAILVIVFSLASIITHIRIGGLMHWLAIGMSDLQSVEFEVLEKSKEFGILQLDLKPCGLKKRLSFPDFSLLDKKFLGVIDVGTASILLFSGLNGVAVFLYVLAWSSSLPTARVWGILTTVTVLLSSKWLSRKYVGVVERAVGHAGSKGSQKP